jgi:hypothetical protein
MQTYGITSKISSKIPELQKLNEDSCSQEKHTHTHTHTPFHESNPPEYQASV